MQAKSDMLTVLPFKGWAAFLVNMGLLASALVLPAIAHVLDAPVRWLLPMHWPVILAGLIYGWRGGLAVGMLAPVLSFTLSGLPTHVMLPVMTAELATYGFIAGFLRERLFWSAYLSVGLALVAGRLVYMGLTALLACHTGGYWEYLVVSLVPGTAAGLGMLLLLPSLARWWVDRTVK